MKKYEKIKMELGMGIAIAGIWIGTGIGVAFSKKSEIVEYAMFATFGVIVLLN